MVVDVESAATHSPAADTSNQPVSPPPLPPQLSGKKQAWAKFDTAEDENQQGGSGDGGSGGSDSGGVTVPGVACDLVVEDIELKVDLENPALSAFSPAHLVEEELQTQQSEEVFSTPTNEALNVSESTSPIVLL